MSGTRRKETNERIASLRISAIIRTKDQSLARDAMRAAVDGGFRMVEFTLTTPGALELIAEFSREEDLLVGAGTVMSPKLVREVVAAGARFIVSPICDAEVVRESAAQDVACIPGAFTPLEMETAHGLGADFVKVFPAPPGGVSYIEAIRGPLPHLRLFPTAGFTPENFTEYLDAGSAGLGFVKCLFDPAELAAREFGVIRQRAEGIVRRLASWRKSAAEH